MNLPNFLTVARILALPFCAWALFKNGGNDPDWQIIAWVMFFIVGMTDVLDGRIARSRNQISAFGTLLDPIADKALTGAAWIGDRSWQTHLKQCEHAPRIKPMATTQSA